MALFFLAGTGCLAVSGDVVEQGYGSSQAQAQPQKGAVVIRPDDDA